MYYNSDSDYKETDRFRKVLRILEKKLLPIPGKCHQDGVQKPSTKFKENMEKVEKLLSGLDDYSKNRTWVNNLSSQRTIEDHDNSRYAVPQEEHIELIIKEGSKLQVQDRDDICYAVLLEELIELIIKELLSKLQVQDRDDICYAVLLEELIELIIKEVSKLQVQDHDDIHHAVLLVELIELIIKEELLSKLQVQDPYDDIIIKDGRRSSVDLLAMLIKFDRIYPSDDSKVIEKEEPSEKKVAPVKERYGKLLYKMHIVVSEASLALHLSNTMELLYSTQLKPALADKFAATLDNENKRVIPAADDVQPDADPPCDHASSRSSRSSSSSAADVLHVDWHGMDFSFPRSWGSDRSSRNEDSSDDESDSARSMTDESQNDAPGQQLDEDPSVDDHASSSTQADSQSLSCNKCGTRIRHVLLGCGHVTCSKCVEDKDNCPRCDQPISKRRNVYI